MGIFLMALILVVCILLALVVLVQNPKGGGLSSGFTGAGNFGGVQRTTDFLEKATWYLTGAFFILCIVAGIYNGNTEDTGLPDESIMPAATTTEGGGEAEGAPAGGEAQGAGAAGEQPAP